MQRRKELGWSYVLIRTVHWKAGTAPSIGTANGHVQVWRRTSRETQLPCSSPRDFYDICDIIIQICTENHGKPENVHPTRSQTFQMLGWWYQDDDFNSDFNISEIGNNFARWDEISEIPPSYPWIRLGSGKLVVWFIEGCTANWTTNGIQWNKTYPSKRTSVSSLIHSLCCTIVQASRVTNSQLWWLRGVFSPIRTSFVLHAFCISIPGVVKRLMITWWLLKMGDPQ